MNTGNGSSARLIETLINGYEAPTFAAHVSSRAVIAANRHALDAGIALGKPCYSLWDRTEPCEFCEAPISCRTGIEREIEIDLGGHLRQLKWAPVDRDLFVSQACTPTDPPFKLRRLERVAGIGGLHIDLTSEMCRDSGILEEILGIDGTYPRTIRAFLQLVHPDDRSVVENAFVAAQAGQSPLRLEIRVKRAADAALRWVIVNAEFGAESETAAEGIFVTVEDITERKMAEDALRASEAKYRRILDDMDDAYFRTDATGHLTLVNPACASAFGFDSPEEMLSAGAHQLYADPAERADVLDTLLREGKVSGRWIKGRRRDGTTFWFSLNARARHDDAGSLCGTEAFARDVTQRKRIQDMLRLQDRILKTLAEGVSLVSAETGRILQTNPAFDAMFGYRPGELDDVPVMSLMVADDSDAAEIEAQIRRSLEIDGTWLGESLYVRKDGSQFWGQSSITQMEHPDFGDLTVGVITDITERKLAERELRESEERFATVFRAGPVSASLARLSDGRLVDVNDQFLQLFGVERQDVVGEHPAPFDYWARPEDHARVLEELKACGRVAGLETTFRTSTGALRDVIFVADLVHIDGEPHVLALTMDVTERNRADRFLRVRADLAELSQTASLEEILRSTLDIAEGLTQSSIGFFHLVDADQQHLSLHTWSTNTLAGQCEIKGKGTHYAVSDAGCWVDSVRTMHPTIHNDYAALEDKQGLPAGHVPVVRELVVPVIRAGNVVAVMGVGNKVWEYTSEDVATMETLGSMVIDHALRRRAQTEFEHFFELAPDMVCVMSLDGRLQQVNPEWEQVLGYSATDLLQHPLLDLVHPEDRLATEDHFTERSSDVGPSGFVNRLRAIDGTCRWVEWNSAALTEEGLIFAVARDITQRRMSEQELLGYKQRLQALASELVTSSERERSRIAVELHDRVAQTLVVARTEAATITPETSQADCLKRLQRVVDLIGESLAEVRELTTELGPPVLRELGLGAALEWLADT